MKKTLYAAASILFSLHGLSQAAETELPSITVTAASETQDSAAIHDVLRTTPQVVLNSQGGSQSDLSVRGSIFSGAGLALGGHTLRNAQTEHFNAELPLPAQLLSRPTLQTGLNNQGGHLVGTVGFNLRPITDSKQLEIGGGTNDRNTQSLVIEQAVTETLGASVFAGRESANGVDYSDNNIDREYAGARLQHTSGDTQIDAVIAHQSKEFGARGYYGAPDTIYAAEKTDDTLFLLSALRGNLHADYLRAGVLWREFNDDYRMPSIDFQSEHRTRTASAFFDGKTIEINGYALQWRLDAEEERIASENLGDHHRTRGGISLLPQWRNDRLTLTAGLRSEFYTDTDSNILPQLGAELVLTDNLTAFASYSETVRLPSYTELNYESPFSLGHNGLQPQISKQSEIGVSGIPSQFMDWKLTAFHRQSNHTIDWILTDADASWTATDIGTLDTYGAEALIDWYPAQNIDIQLAYTWVAKSDTPEDLDAYASRYVLDYAEHLAQASILWRPRHEFEIGTVQTVRLQTDNESRSSSDHSIDGSFMVRYTPPKTPNATLSLYLSNLWDSEFQALPGQRPTSRTAGLSLTLAW